MAETVHPSALDPSRELRLPWNPEYDLWHSFWFSSAAAPRVVLDQMSLLEDGSHMVDSLFPVGTKEQPLGAVVLPHYRTVTDTERICAGLLADILTETILQEEKNI